jgi:hypothetical protein
VTLTLTTVETVVVHSHGSTHKVKKVVTVGTVTITIGAGTSKTPRVTLNAAGRRLLARDHRLKTTLSVRTTAKGKTKTVSTKTVTFTTRKH